MKKLILLALPLILLFSNCKKNNDVLFEMEYFNDFTITAGLNPFAGTHVFETPVVTSNASIIFSENNITVEDLEAINPGSAILRGIFSNPDNGYIREISVKMYPTNDPTFEKEIFYHNQIPENASGDLPLIGTLVDVKDFLATGEFGIKVEFQLRDISPETIDMRLDFEFFAQ